MSSTRSWRVRRRGRYVCCFGGVNMPKKTRWSYRSKRRGPGWIRSEEWDQELLLEQEKLSAAHVTSSMPPMPQSPSSIIANKHIRASSKMRFLYNKCKAASKKKNQNTMT